jgi:uncharacterized protein (DUF427 family)
MTETPYRFVGRVPRGVVPVVPGPGQESVWDYPRPPVIQPVAERVRIRFGGETIVDTTRALRVLETSHAPCYYVPREDIRAGHVTPAPGHTVCEFKGTASYWTITGGDRSAVGAAWSYEDPTPEFRELAGYLAFYASKMDECIVGEEHARPQPGGYYGGWVTSAITGPIKGEEGSGGW